MCEMIICITGTPQTGKSSVAKVLAERLNWKLISLNELAEKKKLYCGYDRERKARVVDIGRIEKEVKKIKGDLVLESHYSHEIPCNLVVVLRTNPAELRKRMKKLGWNKEKIEENIVAEIMEVCKTEALELGRKVIEIDTTEKKPEEIAEEIIDKLNRWFRNFQNSQK